MAALAGGLAAALAAMVANLTVGKKGYDEVWPSAAALADRGQRIKDDLVSAIDADTAAFNKVIDALRLPKGTAEQETARARAIDAASKDAARVPLETSRLCAEAGVLAAEIAAIGNRSSMTDAGVAALMARAGAEGAALNVLTNLGSIADEQFRTVCERDVAGAVARAREAAERALASVNETLSVRANWLSKAEQESPAHGARR